MESYKCNFCAKSFSGLVCFQQHEASEKHKKKVQSMQAGNYEMPAAANSDQFHCPVCMVYISGLDNYQKHVMSLDHALNIQKKNGDLLSQSVSSTFELKTERNQLMESPVLLTSPIRPVAAYAECKPCQKQFSGPEPYQQHLVSAGHKKKCSFSNAALLSIEAISSVGNENINNNSLRDPQPSTCEGDLKERAHQSLLDQSMLSPVLLTNPIKPYAECKPCQKQFSGPEPYQQHLVSAGHKKKCGFSNAIFLNDETDIGVGNKMDCSLSDPLSSCESDHKMVSQPFARCDICNMQFSEAVPYQIHLLSDGHKKQAGGQLLGNSFIESQIAFKCDICVMNFTGPVPYQQHLVSNGHKKKINAAGFSKQSATTGALPPPDSTLKDSSLNIGQLSMNGLQDWYCNICKKQCSGPIPYNTHILSRDHAKNLRILAVEENLKKIQELGNLACVGSDQIDSNISSQVTSSGLHSEFKSEMENSSVEFKINDLNINVKKEDTKILPNKFQINANDLIALPNLNIIPPEKLNVTVFGPDDEVVFSSPRKFKQEFALEMNEEKKMIDNNKCDENNSLMVE